MKLETVLVLQLSDQIFVDKGNMASDIKRPPKLTNRFESRVFWLSKKKISFNKKYLMKINTGEYEVSINKIKKIIDVESLIEKKKTNVEKNDICESCNSFV